MIFLFFQTQVFEVSANKYKFTEDIYAQEDVLTRLRKEGVKEGSDIFNEELKKELLRRKGVELSENTLADTQKRYAETLQELKEAETVEFWKEFSKNMGFAFSSIGVEIKWIGVIGMAISAGYESYIRKNGTLAQKTPSHDIISEIRELREEMRKSVEGLKHEPMIDLEHKYIMRKREIKKHNPSLAQEIERSFIQARADDYFFQLNIPSISCALGLPFQPKLLLDRDNILESRNQWIKKFREDQSFSIYSHDIKEHLLNIICQIINNSISSSHTSSLRVVEHWCGLGSTGKSTAAKLVARFLGLPYFEERITDPSEIRTTSMQGTPRSIQGTFEVGWLVEALLQKTEEGNATYNNGLLILDDFPVNSPEAQSVLLTMTDPERREVFNHKFQVPIDISRLNIFIISNEELRPTSEAQNLTFGALRTRFRSITFPEFDEEQKKSLAEPFLRDFTHTYKPSVLHVFKYLDPTRLGVICDPELLRDMGLRDKSYEIPTGIAVEQRSTITIREIKRFLKEAVNNHAHSYVEKGVNYFRIAKEFKGKPTTVAEVFLKNAAYSGHPKAIGELILQRMESQDDDGKRQVISRFIDRYKANGETKYAKKWLLEVFRKWRYDIVRYQPLLYEIESEEDHQLVVGFYGSFPLDYQYMNDVGVYLYDLGMYIKDKPYPSFKRAKDYLVKAVELGNQAAPSALYALGKKIEGIEEYGSRDAIMCYESAQQHHEDAKYHLNWLKFSNDFEALTLSRETCLVSGIARDVLGNDTKGVMTLCFREPRGYIALVFEMFLPRVPSSISLRMIHYDRADSCFGRSGSERIKIKGILTTLEKVERRKSPSAKGHFPEYERYACWVISNELLKKALAQAEENKTSDKKFNNIMVIRKLMQVAGLEMDEGLKSSQDLKSFVDKDVKPKPHRKRADFSK